MSTLVVQAHPLEQSYNQALLDAVVAQAPDARIVQLGQGQRWSQYACIDVTRMVFVYPTWWGSLPAVLLGALNDIIGPWVDGHEASATSPFKAVESITVVTSHGSSKLINSLQGEPGLQLWKRTILPLCAPGATLQWQSLYKIDRATEDDRRAFLNTITLA